MQDSAGVCLVGLATVIAGTAHVLSADLPGNGKGMEVFVTGNEQSIIERFMAKASGGSGAQFSNSLDHAFAVLLAKAHPAPSAMRLAEATVGALCEEGQCHAHSKVSAAQRSMVMPQLSRPFHFFGQVSVRLTR